MRIRIKKALAILAGLIVAGVIGAVLFAWSGVYNVAASAGHWAVVSAFLELAMRSSVRTYSLGIETPPLDDIVMIRRGLGHYQGGCAICHGSPAEPLNPIAMQMLPPPPFLPDKVHEWTPPRLFWMVKHGLKYTAMPAWPAENRDDEIWSVVAFLVRMPEMSAEEYRRLARGETGGSEPDVDARAQLIARAGAVGGTLIACGRCHGLRGEGGGEGAFPRLAGQKQEYLFESLRSYAAAARPSGIMQPIAAELAEDEMRALAVFYASMDASLPMQGQAQDAATLAFGATIAERGVPEFRVPPCAPCHGAARHGGSTFPLYPRLAGQSAEYLVQQLRLWREGVRGGTPVSNVMTAVASALTDEQIEAVAAYYASLENNPAPGPAQPVR